MGHESCHPRSSLVVLSPLPQPITYVRNPISGVASRRRISAEGKIRRGGGTQSQPGIYDDGVVRANRKT